MIQAIITLIFVLLVAGLIWWVIEQLVPIPEPFRKAIYVLLVLICVLVAVYVVLMLLNSVGVPAPHMKLW
jgi:Ca2+/Na+ antiporter